MKKAAFHNLGCKVNSYEMDVMQQKLEQKGYKIVPFDDVADIYIVNTCTVTNIADRKSRQMLHRAKKQNPDAVVVAVGCYVQTGLEDIEKDDSIDLCIGNNRKAELAEIIERFLEERERTDKTLGHTTVIDIARTSEYETMILHATAEHTRAYIKIQDGCNQFCSYCAIPLARGRVRSRKEGEILDEIRGLVERGYREIVLTGIHISSYGIDFSGERQVYNGQSRLIDLVEEINGIRGLDRIRLSSMEPRIITQDTAERLAGLDKLCPHFHLSLQSGCGETLKRMNRHYTPVEYSDSVELLRNFFAHPAITTDIIVGFPGETEEEFAQSLEFVKRMEFYETHVFKYSKRNRTRAAAMPGQVPDPVKTARSNEILALNRENSRRFRQYYIGKTAEVLFEEEKEIGGQKYWIGHTRDYIQAAVCSGGQGDLSNVLGNVEIQGMFAEDVLKAELRTTVR